MSFKTLCIGINEYTDLAVDNLEGARLDAVALHSLFVDSVPGADAKLLVDGQATLAEVVRALDDVLTAGPDDTVVVAFSGHGEATRGLMLHDSDSASPNSMLTMGVLAEKFQRTRAKNLLVLLDCCESGEGPRQMLRTWRNTRELDEEVLHTSEGGARVILAAANPLQPAWESGVVKGHGLLTASLMGALEGAEGPMEIRALQAVVAERIYAEATRMGEEQNAVGLSVVAGTFALPPLRRGEAYRSAFPERSGATVSGPFLDLERLGIPRKVAEIWAAEYSSGLNELQLKAINDYRLLEGASLLAVAPTSSGKTLIGEMAALRAVARGQRAVFLVPYKALASEQLESFSQRYGGEIGLRVIHCTGDYGDDIPRFARGKYDIAVLTYEMFLNIALQSSTALVHVGAVVIDEAHFISDEGRGITLELLLTLLVAERERKTVPQIVALSAVIGKINHFDEWLGARCLVHDFRPVPLVEGVIDRSGIYKYIDEHGNEKSEQLVPSHEIVQRKKQPEAQDVIVPLARRLLANTKETLLIFRNRKGSTGGCAGYLGSELGLGPAEGALEALPAAASSQSVKLRACLKQGTAFHNTDLVREEKRVVERAFREAREVRVLAATSTLAAGVNTPATTVLIVEHEFPGETRRPFTVAEYKNMAGRAGRPGFADIGRAILYASTWIERDRLFLTYVKGEPGGVRSSFDEDNVDTWLIRLLRQVKKIEERKAISLLANTFGGYTLARRDPARLARIERDLANLLVRMRTLGLVEDYGGKISLTLLGEACGQSSLSLGSCLHFVEMLKRKRQTTARDLMVFVQCVQEMEDAYVPLQTNKAGSGKDYAWRYELASIIGHGGVDELARGAGGEEYLRRCKRTAILLDWIGGMPMERMEEKFTVNGYNPVGLGYIQGVANTTRFHLRSAVDIARVVIPTPLPEEDVALLLERLERGLPANLCDVARRATGLMREEVLKLGVAGLGSCEAIEVAPEDRLRAVLADDTRVALLENAGLRARVPVPADKLGTSGPRTATPPESNILDIPSPS